MAIVRVWAHPGTGERLINDEWIVDTKTRKIAPAEKGLIAHDSSLCLEDFREPGRTAVSAFDGDGHEWFLNLETFQAMPAIAGGDDSPVPLKTCPYHRGCQLHSFLDVHSTAAALFGTHTVLYCPLFECDYISWTPYSGTMSFRDKLLLSVALQQKVLSHKLAEQFVGNGK